MAKSKNEVNITKKREMIPRKAKEQSEINMIKMAVIMEVLEASSVLDSANCDFIEKKDAKMQKRRKIKIQKQNYTKLQDNSSKDCQKTTPIIEKEPTIQENLKMFREPQPFLTNVPGLSHFMNLEERTDLLCNSPMADPLGPDSFDNFEWVQVKKEISDDLEVSKITFLDLPLKYTYENKTYSEINLPVESGNTKTVLNENYMLEDDKSITDNWVQELSIEECSNKSQVNNNKEDYDVQEYGHNDNDKNSQKTSFQGPLKHDASQVSGDMIPSVEDSQSMGQVDENEASEDDKSVDDWWGEEFTIEDSSVKLDDNNKKVNSGKKQKVRPQNCDTCGEQLSSKESLRLHKLKKHEEKVQFTCELCGLKFEFQRELIGHRNSTHRQEDGRFCCEVCNKRIIEYRTFILHLKSHIINCKEEEGSDKVCIKCNKSFQDDESLKIHKVLHHTVEDIDLKEKRKSPEKNFICNTCGKRFAFNCLLQDHINLHTGAKPYLCQICGKCFAQKATLKQHSKTHNEIRPFQCSECSLGFYSRGDLKKHFRKHSGERPYICEMCGEGFSRSSHLGVHLRSHTGERPFSCGECGRGFTKRGDVVRHQRTHTGELPYLCQVCGKAFRQSTQCANHIKSQHPDATALVAKNPNPLHHSIYNHAREQTM